MAKETAVEIIDIYTHKVEKRLDKLGTYLVFVVIPLLLIIAMQLGALIIYLLILGSKSLFLVLTIAAAFFIIPID